MNTPITREIKNIYLYMLATKVIKPEPAETVHLHLRIWPLPVQNPAPSQAIPHDSEV
jgi:hypothetical protein